MYFANSLKEIRQLGFRQLGIAQIDNLGNATFCLVTVCGKRTDLKKVRLKPKKSWYKREKYLFQV